MKINKTFEKSQQNRLVNGDFFFNADGRIKKKGDQVQNLKLAKMFRDHLARDKWAFHKGNQIILITKFEFIINLGHLCQIQFLGTLAKTIANEIQNEGGIITSEGLGPKSLKKVLTPTLSEEIRTLYTLFTLRYRKKVLIKSKIYFSRTTYYNFDLNR